MQQQSERITALYYRVAGRTMEGVLLDNQICKLLCYAKERRLNSYALYADIGVNGITSDRPALNALRSDIQAGRISTVALYGVDRLFRDCLTAVEFIQWARTYGVEFYCAIDGEAFLKPVETVDALLHRLPKGGRR